MILKQKLIKYLIIFVLTETPFCFILLLLHNNKTEWDNFIIPLSVLSFILFSAGIFYFVSNINEIFVEPTELTSKKEYSCKVEFCNLSNYRLMFNCASYPLSRISLYKDFFVIVWVFKIFKFSYKDVEQISLKKFKLSKKIWFKMKKGYPQEFYICPLNREVLLKKLLEKIERNKLTRKNLC
ncbi:conserved hypothetical protein [Thermotomaculum hydrothermale]|uniref:Uncharacterized protein n=1 Tax=Thermotomaculum hydrothermale TaxID=981385 RepID=A0A7R6SYM3_9BACT|nr:hypothetical protein [Thermotomaculum hydrothermale]BBB32716.1 conserved hypothetical protein [Thermotomaculum hydrothermale]